MNQLTGVAETDIHILRYLDVNTIISILEAKNKYFSRLILDVIRLHKQDDQRYLSKLLIWANKNDEYQIFKLLIENGVDIHAKDDYAFRCAAAYEHRKIVKLLLENGADIHARNDEALQWACYTGNIELVKFLVDQGAYIHAINNYQLLLISGDLDIVKYLVDQGADRGVHSIIVYLIEIKRILMSWLAKQFN